MERLTFEGNFCDIAQCTSTPGGSFCENGTCSQRKVWERLKAYEDTGLTPEEIDMDHEAAEELRRLCRDYDLGRLEELIGADKDGRLVMLPPEDYYWKIRGDLMLGIIAANCRAAEKAGEAEEAKRDG